LDKQLISTNTAFEQQAKYSRAVRVEDLVFVSGTVGFDPVTGTLPASFNEQFNNCLTIIRGALRQAGCSLEDVVMVRVYLVGRANVSAVVACLSGAFQDVRPANTTIICELPVPEALLEIEVFARRS
jgi:enamine deaminase RidA (YjgF/YER057c/UK114 family)